MKIKAFINGMLITVFLSSIISCKISSNIESNFSNNNISSANIQKHAVEYQDVKGIDDANESGISYWKEISIRNQAQANQNIGGEGCQWPLTLEGDSTGQYIYYGTDVGGIYRSRDYGATFEKCMTDFLALGASDFAVDPNNNSKLLALGVNGNRSSYTTGIYSSDNYGTSWKFNFHFPVRGARDTIESLAFDPSSYDESLNGSRRVYTSLLYERDSSKCDLTEETKGLYASDDGGLSWYLLNNELSDGIVKVSPKGYVYVGKLDGLYESKDKGITFNKILDAKVTGLDFYQDDLYILTDNLCENNKLVKAATIYKYNDKLIKMVSFNTNNVDLITDPSWQPFFVKSGGDTKNEYHYEGLSHELLTLKVCPTNSQKMLISYKNGYLSWKDYSNGTLYTEDGGATWHIATYTKTNEFFPLGNRTTDYYWSPTNENYIINFNNDIVSASTDGGQTFHYNSNGINGVMIGGKFNFNVNNPDIMFFASQDYAGALTVDGGNTWKYINLSKSEGEAWNAYVYAGYAASENVVYGAVAKSWSGDRYLSISYDGGKTIVNHRNDDNYKLDSGKNGRLTAQSNYISYQAPYNANILFCGNLRSTDFGLTWQKMMGVTGVYDCSSNGKLFGIDDNTSRVVTSIDDGKTWQTYVESLSLNPYAKDGLYLSDLSYDDTNDRLYIAAQWCALFVVSENGTNVKELSGNIPVAMQDESMPGPDEFNIYGDLYYARRVYSVAVDKSHPEIVYIGGSSNGYQSDSNVFRSCDMGQTFNCLTTNTTTSIIKNDVYGGGSSVCLRVNAKTGELWSATNCLGFGKITPPYETNYSEYKEISLVSDYDNILNKLYVKQNRLVKLPNLSDSSFEFEGWYYDKKFTKKVDKLISKEDITIYAKWKKKN